MGMLMHHTWEEMQKKKESPKKVAPAEEPREEPVNEEPVKKTGGRRKTK